MTIRPYITDDFERVWAFLDKAPNVDAPRDIWDIEGLAFVAEEDGDIVGFIYALVGLFKAYVDFFAVAEKYRGKALAYRLFKKLEDGLRKYHVKRFYFQIEMDNKHFLNIAEKIGAERLRDVHFLRREVIPHEY